MTAATIDSDIALLSACLLLSIDPEAIEERAAILEYDGGMSHDAANRGALFLTMAARDGRFTRGFADGFFELAGRAVDLEQEHGWQRTQTIDWLMERMERPGSVASQKFTMEDSTFGNHIQSA